MPDRTPASLWETALGQLELQVTRPNFETWLRNTVGLHIDGDLLTVGVPSDFAIEWLRSRMTAPINRAVSQLLGRSISVSFQVLGAQPLSPPPSSNGRHPLSPTAPPLTDLNHRLTFDSFTVVKTNRLAYRAALRLASGEDSYNPLILYGNPGLGKTHLLHAIAHRAAQAGINAALLTAEAFVDRYSRAVEAKQRHTFRDGFTNIELLLLDDMQFLAGRPGSQDQFFHIFNALLAADRRIVLTMDVPPNSLGDISPPLRSRLLAGLAVELRLPPATECIEILRSKASHLSQPIPDATLQAITARPFQHIRELEGALNRLDAYSELTATVPSPDILDRALHSLEPHSRPSPDAVLSAVCDYLHVSQEHLSGPSRARDITYARHIAMYLLRFISHRPLTEIGALLGDRDHSTISNGSQRIKQELSTLAETQSHIQHLTAILQSEPAA